MPTATSSASGGDFIDHVRRQWATTYPEVETSPIEVIGRITRIGSLALHHLERTLAGTGVSRVEFEILCALARSDRPLRASEVTTATMTSGASTTKYADRLTRAGFIERLPFERDGRVVLLQLTDTGRAVVDEAFPARVERDRRMLEGLDDDERTTLANLLRRIAANLEPGP